MNQFTQGTIHKTKPDENQIKQSAVQQGIECLLKVIMGIQGLLPFVKEATEPVNMRKYSGYAVAVDTYCWLHKGAFACSLQLAKGESTDV